MSVFIIMFVVSIFVVCIFFSSGLSHQHNFDSLITTTLSTWLCFLGAIRVNVFRCCFLCFFFLSLFLGLPLAKEPTQSPERFYGLKKKTIQTNKFISRRFAVTHHRSFQSNWMGSVHVLCQFDYLIWWERECERSIRNGKLLNQIWPKVVSCAICANCYSIHDISRCSFNFH